MIKSINKVTFSSNGDLGTILPKVVYAYEECDVANASMSYVINSLSKGILSVPVDANVTLNTNDSAWSIGEVAVAKGSWAGKKMTIFEFLTKFNHSLKQPDLLHIHKDFENYIQFLDDSLNQLLTIQSNIGGRLNIATMVKTSHGDAKYYWNQLEASVQDLDYPSAIIKLNEEMLMLDSVRKSFAQIAGHSLFDFI